MFRQAIFLVMAVVIVGSEAKNFCTDNSRQIDPFVSTEWLARHINDRGMILLDVRTIEAYNEGHVLGSVSAPISQWWVIRDELLLELPEPDDLRVLIGNAGITSKTKVVIIGQTDSDYDRANGTRVAWTLIYAGIKNIAILDGGITKWLSENRAISTDSYIPTPQVYNGRFNEDVLVTKSYVNRYLNCAKIIDNRIPEDFFGVSPLEFSTKEGHIKGASSLPTPWVFTKSGTFKDIAVLEEMATNVVGKCKNARVITYCGVGGYGATWWYILSEVLGYQNVSLYDGSIQEWTRDPRAPVQKFTW